MKVGPSSIDILFLLFLHGSIHPFFTLQKGTACKGYAAVQIIRIAFLHLDQDLYENFWQPQPGLQQPIFEFK